MTDKANDGPAFPFNEKDGDGKQYHSSAGMTLRDYFAAKAMAGDWSCQSEETGQWDNDANAEILEERAALYYRMADAMLAARSAS